MVPCPSARPKAASTRSATREEVSTLPAATAAGERAFRSEPSGRHDRERAEGARAGGSVRVGDHPQGEVAGGQRHGQRAVEVAVVLVGAAGEVQLELVARARSRVTRSSRSPSAASSTSVRHALAVLDLRQLRARAPLGIVEGLGHARAQRVGTHPFGQRREPLAAGSVGGQLSAQVRLALARAAHLARQVVEKVTVERCRRATRRVGGITTPSSSSVRESAGMLPGSRGAHVGVVRAAGGEADRLAAVGEHGGDDGDVREVRAAGEGVVEDPGVARRLVLVEYGRHGGGHRSQMHRDVLGLHHQLALGVEEGSGGVAALLDVGRVGRADEHHAHLVAGGAQRAEHHLESDRVELHLLHHHGLGARASARQPGGTTSVEPGRARIAGPSTLAGAGPEQLRLVPLVPEAGAAGAERCSASLGGRLRRLGAGERRRHPHGHELELRVVVVISVALGVCAVERACEGRRARGPARPSIGSSKAWPLVAQLVGGAKLRLGRAELLAPARAQPLAPPRPRPRA